MGTKASSGRVDWASFLIASVPSTNGPFYPCFFHISIFFSFPISFLPFSLGGCFWDFISSFFFFFFFHFHDTGCSPLFLRLMEHLRRVIAFFGSDLLFPLILFPCFLQAGTVLLMQCLRMGIECSGHDEPAVTVIGTNGDQKELSLRFALCCRPCDLGLGKRK